MRAMPGPGAAWSPRMNPPCRVHLGADSLTCFTLSAALRTEHVVRMRVAEHLEKRIWRFAMEAGASELFEELLRAFDRREGWRDSIPAPALLRSCLVFHVSFEGARPAAAAFMEIEGATLCRAERAWLEVEREARLSFWQVVHRAPKGWLAVDTMSGELVELAREDVPAWFLPNPKEVFFGRVLRQEGRAIVRGVEETYLSGQDAQMAIRLVQGTIGATQPERLFAIWDELVPREDRAGTDELDLTG